MKLAAMFRRIAPALCLWAAGVAAPAHAQPPQWRTLDEGAGGTLQYDQRTIGALYNNALPAGAAGRQIAAVGTRTTLRGAADGAFLDFSDVQFDCGQSTKRMTRQLRLRENGTIAAASHSDGGAWQPVRPGSADARLSAIACERSREGRTPDAEPEPVAASGAEDAVGWAVYNPASPELRRISQELASRCRARGRPATFIADSQFSTDADMDGDADDFVFYEAGVQCIDPGRDFEDSDIVCPRDCRQWLFVDHGNGLEPAWAGTSPVISGNGHFAVEFGTGTNAALRPARWDGHRFVQTNGTQGDDGVPTELEPDAFVGSGRVDMPIRVDCVDDSCSWMRERARTMRGVGSGERLFSLTVQLGYASYMPEHADFYYGLAGPEWLEGDHQISVLCSATRPAVLTQSSGGYRYRLVNLDQAGDDHGARRLYIAVCHPGIRPGDQAAVRRLSEMRPPATGLEGRVDRIEHIPTAAAR